MPDPSPSTMRRDILSAYMASGMKVASWAIATMLVWRNCGQTEFATFALIRGTLSFLNFTTIGLAPAIIHHLTQAARQTRTATSIPLAQKFETETAGGILPYHQAAYIPEQDPQFHAREIAFSALLLALILGCCGYAIAVLYAGHVTEILNLDPYAEKIALFFGAGIAIRLASDACGALLQAFGKITADNFALALAEAAWIVILFRQVAIEDLSSINVAGGFLMASGILFTTRLILLPLSLGPVLPRLVYFNISAVGKLFWFGLLVSVAQLADYLYAPTDYILINHLIDLTKVAVYAPAVQIDAGLLLIVGGLAAVMLPKSAIAHAAGKTETVRQYFVRGTLASAVMLLIAAAIVCTASPVIFQYWLGSPMKATQAILPLFLIHTVVGGSSAVGRSILLGMGKVKPFTAAVLIAGVSNVILSYAFVRFGHLGLTGIVLGTICAVVGRCAIWQPWYVWRCLRRADYNSADAVPDLPQTGG